MYAQSGQIGVPLFTAHHGGPATLALLALKNCFCTSNKQ
jgi:hypothetical protein